MRFLRLLLSSFLLRLRSSFLRLLLLLPLSSLSSSSFGSFSSSVGGFSSGAPHHTEGAPSALHLASPVCRLQHILRTFLFFFLPRHGLRQPTHTFLIPPLFLEKEVRQLVASSCSWNPV